MYHTDRWTRLHDSAQEIRQQKEVLLPLTRRSLPYIRQNSKRQSLNLREFRPNQSREIEEKDSKIRERAPNNERKTENGIEEEEEAGVKKLTVRPRKAAKCNSLQC